MFGMDPSWHVRSIVADQGSNTCSKIVMMISCGRSRRYIQSFTNPNETVPVYSRLILRSATRLLGDSTLALVSSHVLEALREKAKRIRRLLTNVL